MDRIYEDLKDLHIKATMVYVNDSKAYKDSAHTEQYKTSELKEVFLKGCMIQVSTALYMPTGYSETSKVGSVHYATGTTSAAISSAAAVAD